MGVFKGVVDRSLLGLAGSCLILAGAPLGMLGRLHWPLLVVIELILVAVALRLNPRHRGKVAIFVLAGLLFLFGGEVYLRVRYFGVAGLSFDRYRPASYGHPWSRFEYSAETYTGLKPNTAIRFKGKMFSVNADGFRGKTYVRPKPEGVYRIILLGASATMGSGLEDPEVMTEVMEARLNATGFPMRVEVVNLSIGGSRLGEMIHCLEAVGMSYEPDLILVGFNQMLIPPQDVDIEARAVRPVSVPAWRKVADQTYSYLGSRFFFSDLLEQFRAGEIGVLGQRLTLPPPRPGAGGVRPPFPEGQRRNVAEGMARIRRAAGTTPVMAYLFRTISNTMGLDGPDYRAWVAEQASARGVEVMDATELEFGDYRELDLIVYPGDKHPNALAHRIYGERLADAVAEFIRRGAVPRPAHTDGHTGAISEPCDE